MAGVAVPPSDGDEPLGASGGEETPGARGTATGGGQEMAAFRRFQRFLQQDQDGLQSPRRQRRRRDDEEDEDEGDGRGQSGPPPTWDGSTPFEDYYIKAKLWMATTKAKGRSRGPLLLKSLSSTPFETFKHYAKDQGWLSDVRGAERLLEEMNKPEFYGDDQQEHMLTALSRITYHMKRGRNETWREFFSRWDVALRRVHDHKINLPEEYEGFLMINGLQLSEMETKNMLNFTHGCIRPRSIKEWLRKNETKLSAAELGADKKKVTSSYLTEVEAHVLEEEVDQGGTDGDPEIEELELYINDLLDPEETAENDILDESEAAEILSTILQKKKTYSQSIRSKKEKELSRGYGFSKGGGKGKYQNNSWPKGGQYRVSGNMTIEEIKRRTRCRRCQEIGHWKRECPNPPKPRSTDGNKPNETHYLTTTNEAIFIGMLEKDFDASLPEPPNGEFRSGPTSGQGSDSGFYDGSESAEVYTASDQLGQLKVCELFHFQNWFCENVNSNQGISIHEETCATVDTGCQRLAIGSETLKKYMKFLPNELKVTLHPEINRFKSVHQVSTTTRVATVPCALGSKGCFLRPAVFDCDPSEHAPFLISLTFLLHCDSELRLSQEHGLHIQFRGSQEILPLHLGPTGALRIPLQRFNQLKLSVLQKAQEELHDRSRGEFEVLNLKPIHVDCDHSNSVATVDNSPAKASDPSSSHGAFRETCSWQCGAREQVNQSLGKDLPEGAAGHDADLQCSRKSSDEPGEPQAAGYTSNQCNGHGGVDLHPGVRQRSDQEEGARDGRPGQGLLFLGNQCGTRQGNEEDSGGVSGINYADQLGESDANSQDTTQRGVSIPIGGKHDLDPIGVRGEDRRCQGLGTGLRNSAVVSLRNGDQTSPESERGQELREDLPSMPKSYRPPMPILHVDELPTVPGRGELQVQELRAEGVDLCGGPTADCAGAVCTPHYNQGREQRLRREGDVCDVQEGATLREEAQHSHSKGREGPQGHHGPGLRRVPEVSRVAASTEEVGEKLQEIPPKTVRKIKAAVQKAVGFW